VITIKYIYDDNNAFKQKNSVLDMRNSTGLLARLGIIVFLLSFISALNPPQQYFGDVSYNGQIIQGKYSLTLKLIGVNDSICTITAGKYGWDPICFIESPDSASGIVGFYLCGLKIGESTFLSGESTNLNFNLTSAPACASEAYCGDRSCNNGETCSTCSADCGACSSSSSGGGSSGGGGGGSHTTTTTKLNTTNQSNEIINLGSNLGGLEGKEDKITTPDTWTDEQGLFSKFIGEGTGMVFIIAIIILLGIIIYITMMQRKSESERIKDAISKVAKTSGKSGGVKLKKTPGK